MRRLPPRPDPGRRPQERRADGRPRPAAGGPRRRRPRPGPAAVPRPEHLGRAGRPGALPGHDGGEVRRPGRRSSSSTTPPSPSRASTPSASSGSTAGPWARRPTASAPSRSTTSPRRATTRWTCGSTCPRPGWATRSGSTRPACPRSERRPLTKGQIALELLDRVRGRGAAGRARGGRRRLRRLGAVPRRPGRAGPALHRRGDRRDGRLHRGAAVGRADGRDGRPAAEAAPAGRGLAPAGQPEGAGGADAAAEGDLAGGDQGADVGPVRLAAGLAGRRLGDRASAPGPSRSGC